ncbi:MAG: hypothetical protein QM674_09820 [Burkholderiaceae bacterium]
MEASMSECDAVLLSRSTTILSERFEESLDWLNLVTEANYSSVKESAGAIIPGYLSGDYDNFKQARRELYNRTSYSRDTLASRSLVTSTVPDAALEVWVQCVRARNRGLVCYVKNVTDVGADIKISFQKPIGGTAITATDFRLNQGNLAEGADNFSGKPGFEGEESIYVTRTTPTDPIRGAVAVYFGSAVATDEFFIPGKIEHAPPPAEKWANPTTTGNKSILTLGPRSVPFEVTASVRYEVFYETPGDPWFEIVFTVDEVEKFRERKWTRVENQDLNHIARDDIQIKVPAGKTVTLKATVNNLGSRNKSLDLSAVEVRPAGAGLLAT